MGTLAPKSDFPLLSRQVHGQTLTYLDSAASAQKPQSVLDAMDVAYSTYYANVHRGVYTIAEEATQAFEGARRTVARFINAASASEVVFTQGTTAAMNLLAYSWGSQNLAPGDVVVISQMEHHANIVPWQMATERTGAELVWIPITADGYLDLTGLDELLERAKVISVTAVSNVLGTINDLTPVIAAAKERSIPVFVDAAQSAPHLALDVQALGADAVAFSAHKLLGATGIGALWATPSLLEAMPPFMGGGEMINDVRFDGFDPAPVPHKFEAGTPPIVEAIGFAAAIDYLSALGMDAVAAHEHRLAAYAMDALSSGLGERIRIFGPSRAEDRCGVISFELDSVHPHDVSQVLDEHAVCVRAGHHCAKPLMRILDVPATARASFYVYNEESDVDQLVAALDAAHRFFV